MKTYKVFKLYDTLYVLEFEEKDREIIDKVIDKKPNMTQLIGDLWEKEIKFQIKELKDYDFGRI